MKVTCLIIDDELTARQGLEVLCAEYDQLKVVGSCKNGIEAIDEINSHRPDLILLDIQMPKVNGFEVLTSIAPPLPEVIFITAHDEFAIKAFEVNAIDYILKPFSDDRFDKAIRRALERISSKDQMPLDAFIKSQKLQKNDAPEIRDSDEYRLVFKANGGIHIVKKAEITLVEAYDYYVKIHTSDQVYLLRETMKNMEMRLESLDFSRTHKSYIVNKNFVKSFNSKSGEHELLLTNNQFAKVSRAKVSQVKEWLG